MFCKLIHTNSVHNSALAAGKHSARNLLWFVRDPWHDGYHHIWSYCGLPPCQLRHRALDKNPKSEWRCLRYGDRQSTGDLRGGRELYLALAVVIFVLICFVSWYILCTTLHWQQDATKIWLSSDGNRSREPWQDGCNRLACFFDLTPCQLC